MVIKWIKAIFIKPLTIIKSFIFRYKNTNEHLSETRLVICRKCKEKLNTTFGEVCGQCGCILENKTRLENEHCDLFKW